MSEGKAQAQAGHAFVGAILQSLSSDAEGVRRLASCYASLQPGTKISLDGGSEADLYMLCDRLDAQGIPFVRIIDSGHVEPPHFDGSDVLTGVGVGPFPKSETPKVLRRLPLIGKRQVIA